MRDSSMALITPSSEGFTKTPTFATKGGRARVISPGRFPREISGTWLMKNKAQDPDRIDGCHGITQTRNPANLDFNAHRSANLCQDLRITGGKIIVNMSALGIKTKTASLPEIHLTELGKDSGGITARELSQKVAKLILENVLASAGGIVGDLQKSLADPSQALKDALQQTNGTPKEVKDVLRRLKL